MRGVGGPLLCIGDLLSDVGDEHGARSGAHQADMEDANTASSSPSSPSAVSPATSISALAPGPLDPSDLHQIFQVAGDLKMLGSGEVEDNYSKLVESLEGNDHSWTSLTLQLCSALKTTDKLVSSANSNIGSLLQTVQVLENILKRGDSVAATVKTMSIMHAMKDNSEKN